MFVIKRKSTSPKNRGIIVIIVGLDYYSTVSFGLILYCFHDIRPY